MARTVMEKKAQDRVVWRGHVSRGIKGKEEESRICS